jgi:hypothetical protein
MKVFLEKIDERDSRILSLITEPKTLDEIAGRGPVYGKKFLVDDWIYMWNKLMVKKHMQRLVRNGTVVTNGDRYALAS